jgi:hypothetical protein
MAAYASEQQLSDYCADNPDVTLPGSSDAVERLLRVSGPGRVLLDG